MLGNVSPNGPVTAGTESRLYALPIGAELADVKLGARRRKSTRVPYNGGTRSGFKPRQPIGDGMERRRPEKRSRSPKEPNEKVVTSHEVWGNVGRRRVLHHPGGEDPETVGRARRANDRRFLSFDLLYSVSPCTEVGLYLFDNGMTRDEYRWFRDQPRFLAVVLTPQVWKGKKFSRRAAGFVKERPSCAN